MSVRIQYAYLKQQTWLYRRNYPKELQPLLGQAYKQSLKTGDARVAKARAAEVNAKYEEIITKAKAGGVVEKPQPVRIVAPAFAPVTIVGRVSVAELGKQYLNRRSNELQHGGFKSVRFSVGLFVSQYGRRPIGTVTREDALAFTRKVAQLGKHVGKSYRTRGYPLERLLALSEGEMISPQTQRRIVSQVGHFLDWTVYEGQLASNPFKTVRVEGRAKPQHYEALTDEEVLSLLSLEDPRISKKILPLLHGLAEVGMIDVAKGSYSGPAAWWNRTTRIRAAEPLIALFRPAQATRDDIRQIEGQECIVLKSGDGDGAKLAEYEDTPETLKMRKELHDYNTLLADTYIDIPTLEDPWTTRLDDRGKEVRVLIDHHHQLVRRIFSRGDWGCNGRFYGPWWQQIGKELRSQIFINDTPTVEVDYKGLHVAILSAQMGVAVAGDPYALAEGLVAGTPPSLQRALVKKLVLTALNARSKAAAYSSFREGFPSGHMAKGLNNKELDALLAAFTEHHPHLAEFLCADQGIRLMNTDGKIAEFVHRWFTRRRIPVLSVHDSFIIDYTRVDELKRVMGLASKWVVGKALEVEASGQGLGNQLGAREVSLDFECWRETARGDGYRNRLKWWEERKGREVVSFSRGGITRSN